MTETPHEIEPTRRRWNGFWCMIAQQTQNAFNDKIAQFTLIPLGGAVGFALMIPIGAGIEVDVPSAAGLMMATPMVLFAPIAGWLSDRYSKRNVMIGAAIAQAVVLAWICLAVTIKNMPLALCGFFALSVQSAFFSPAKIGINKELVGSRHLGFAAGIQQMTAILAILAGQIIAARLFDYRFKGHGGGEAVAWHAALIPLLWLAALSVPALALAWAIPKVPAQGGARFTARLAISHFLNLADLWRDAPLRQASFGVAFFWGFAAYINLWSLKLAKFLTGGGEGYGTMSSLFMAAASTGMALGFGFAAMMLRRKIELAWVPAAGVLMTLTAIAMAFIPPPGPAFLTVLALLGFSGAVFLSPLNAWMQDRYPTAKRGELQSAVNLQDCLAGIIAVLAIGVVEIGTRTMGIAPENAFRIEIAFVGLCCGVASVSIIRLLPADFLRLLGVAMVRSVYHIKTVHADRVPQTGGALLLPNHVTFADAFFITAASPRPVRFVMDEAFVTSRAVRLFTTLFDTVTIRREQPREAIRITIDALKKGDLVCLFPEGQLTRTGALCELRRGFELIAKKAGHPLLPLWCDGSWGSIFSFERGRFFSKRPYRVPYGLSIAFGERIAPAAADIKTVRHGMMVASAKAIAARFAKPGWSARIPGGANDLVAKFRASGEAARRRMWINGHQIGQVNALQRGQPFRILHSDRLPCELPSVMLTYPQLFGAEVVKSPSFACNEPAAWLGGDLLRGVIASAATCTGIVFFDFSGKALEPLEIPGVTHCPCLAVDGTVVAMSMPDPPLPSADSEPQTGRKNGAWGKLLPGYFLLETEGVLRVHGPAAPAEGLALPDGCTLDAEGFLTPA